MTTYHLQSKSTLLFCITVMILVMISVGCSPFGGGPAPDPSSTETSPTKKLTVVVHIEDGTETSTSDPQIKAMVRPEPLVNHVTLNQKITIQILIDDVVNLTGGEMDICFNPTVLQVIDADHEKTGIQVQHGNYLVPDIVVSNEVDNTNGKITYAIVQFPPNPPLNGTGTFLTVTFKGIADGESEVSFEIIKLADDRGAFIAHTVQNGVITVGDNTQ